MSTASVLV